MKLRRFDIERFGKFESLSLDFQTERGLTVILGQNEAGKSTLREALLSFLFGIPDRLGPKYLYDGRKRKDIRLVAEVLLKSGENMEALRTGKRGDQSLTGVSSTGQKLTPQMLQHQLGTLNRDMYASLFGFSLEDLTRGAEGLRHSTFQDLIEGGALGGAGNLLKELRTELKTICDAEFTSSQRKSAELMQAFLQCDELSAEVRELSMRKGDIQDLLDKRKALNQRLVDLDAEKATLSRDYSITNRLSLIAPTWEELASLRVRVESGELLSKLKDVTEIERLQEQVEHWSAARHEYAGLLDQVSTLTAERGQFRIQRELLAAGSQLDGLKEQLAQVAELRAGLGGLSASATQASRGLEQARQQHAELYGETLEAEALLSRAVDHQLYSSLENACELTAERERELQTLEGKLGLHTHALAAREKDLADTKQRTADPKLLALFSEIDSVTTREQGLCDLQNSILKLSGELDAEASAFTPPLPQVEELHRLSLPARADLQPLAAREKERGLRILRENDRTREAQNELLELHERMEGLRSHSGTENVLEALMAARQRRDELWEQLRSWVADDHRSAGGITPSLPTNLGDAIQAADAAADAVASAREQDLRMASVQADIVRQQAKLSASTHASEDLDREDERDAELLCKLFEASGVDVKGCRAAAMVEWWERFQVVKKLSASLAIKVSERDEAEAQLAAFKARALKTMPDSGPETLREVLVVLEEQRRAHVEGAAEKRQLEQAVKGDRAAVAQVAEQVSRQRQLLTEARTPETAPWTRLNWSKDLSVEGVWARLQATDQLADLAKQAAQANAATQAAQKTIESFEQAINAIQATLPDSVASPATEVAASAEALLRFYCGLLEEAREAQRRYNDQDRALTSVAAQAEQRRASLSKLEAALEPARKEYDCDDLPALEHLIRRAAEALPWLREERKLTASLKPHNVSLEEARERLDSGGAEVFADRERVLHDQLKALDDEHRSLTSELKQLELKQRQWGGAEAAEVQARLSEAQATLHQLYEQHAVHRVALRLLSDASDQWRRNNEPRLIEKTSDLLSRITDGAYVGLRQKLGEDSFVLVDRDGNERSDQTLSLGTAEQTFLALRLAFAEIWCESHEPLPILIDDAFANFDVSRQRASMRTLGDVSEKTQVVFLTCHPHLAEMAAEKVSGTRVLNLAQEEPSPPATAKMLKRRASN